MWLPQLIMSSFLSRQNPFNKQTISWIHESKKVKKVQTHPSTSGLWKKHKLLAILLLVTGPLGWWVHVTRTHMLCDLQAGDKKVTLNHLPPHFLFTASNSKPPPTIQPCPNPTSTTGNPLLRSRRVAETRNMSAMSWRVLVMMPGGLHGLVHLHLFGWGLLFSSECLFEFRWYTVGPFVSSLISRPMLQLHCKKDEISAV